MHGLVASCGQGNRKILILSAHLSLQLLVEGLRKSNILTIFLILYILSEDCIELY